MDDVEDPVAVDAAKEVVVGAVDPPLPAVELAAVVGDMDEPTSLEDALGPGPVGLSPQPWMPVTTRTVENPRPKGPAQRGMFLARRGDIE